MPERSASLLTGTPVGAGMSHFDELILPQSTHQPITTAYLSSVIDALLDHIWQEEQLCDQLGIKLSPAHLTDHDTLAEKLSEIKRTLEADAPLGPLLDIRRSVRRHMRLYDAEHPFQPSHNEANQ